MSLLRKSHATVTAHGKVAAPYQWAPLMAALLCSLAACGGGGGGSGGETQNAPVVSANDSTGSNTGNNNGNNTGGNTGGTPGEEQGTEPPPGTGNSPAPLPTEPHGDPKVVGQWSPVYEWPQVAINLTLLPNGKLLSWSRLFDNHTESSGGADHDSGEAYLVDVPNGGIPGNFTYVPNETTKLFCSGQTLLADGRLFAAGGETGVGGSDHANIFDFRNNTWQRVADMSGLRWYPTTTTLANGDVLTLGGTMTFANLDNNTLPQVWDVANSVWRNLTGARYDVGEYPRMHLAPNGQVFKSGVSPLARYLDTSGTGKWTDVATFNFNTSRSYGSSVLYGDGKVIVMGGGEPPTETAEIINLYDENPQWKYTKPMHFKRRQINATIMADGKILVTGGLSGNAFNDASSAVYYAESWDPDTGEWTLLDWMKIPRLYHSTAVLLPDGRILSAGGGQPNADHDVDHFNAEIYSPPYLFKGSRPVISDAPESIKFGEKFFVQTPDAQNVVKATWIRLGSATHAFNMNQRINYLTFNQAQGGLNITAPADANLTPPGHYMLFLLNDKGVPSIAKIIQIT